jgi:hypothetical protein
MIIRTENTEQCPDILPVNDVYGSGLVLEKRCILDKDHEGMHLAQDGAYWVNQHDLMRQRGLA